MKQAKSYVLQCLAAEARHHIGNGSEWLERPSRSDGFSVDADGRFSESDFAKVVDAVRTVANDLESKSIRIRANEAERKLKKLAKLVKP